MHTVKQTHKPTEIKEVAGIKGGFRGIINISPYEARPREKMMKSSVFQLWVMALNTHTHTRLSSYRPKYHLRACWSGWPLKQYLMGLRLCVEEGWTAFADIHFVGSQNHFGFCFRLGSAQNVWFCSAVMVGLTLRGCQMISSEGEDVCTLIISLVGSTASLNFLIVF